MPDFRVFCPPPVAESREIVLSTEESHHLVVVNRARRGAVVVAFDGDGTEWTCELTGDRKNAATLTIASVRRIAPLPYRITLGQALPKGAVMDTIVRKATELGAARIVPLESERSQVHFDFERSERKVEKWHVAALEAAKQCGNAFLPRIDAIQPAAAFMAKPEEYDLKLIASLHPGARPLRTILRACEAARRCKPVTALWLIGPEGDFSPEEMSLAHRAGFEPVTLGPLVLRCDTAAVCALSVLGYELLAAEAALGA